MTILTKAAVATTTATVIAGVACAVPGLSPPTPAEILGKPAKSDMKDGHFALTGHLTSGGTGLDLKGDGLMVLKPKSAFRMSVSGSLGIFPFTLEVISVDGQDYQRVGSQKWTKSTSARKPPVADGWSGLKDSKLVGEEELSQGKAWHVKATGSDGKPFDAWVRETDGYPLKVVTGDPDSNFTLAFDRFNTAQTVSVPAASDIKPDAKRVSGVVGQPIHLNGVDVSVVTADLNAKPSSQYFGPKAGNRYVTVQVLYESTGSDKYDYNPFDWKLTDSSGFSYDHTFGGIGPELHSGSLNAGEKARGYITYDVPSSASGLTLKLTSGEDSATVSIG